MPEVVEFRREGPIAVITVNHPPVNALNIPMRKGLVEALQRAQRGQGGRGGGDRGGRPHLHCRRRYHRIQQAAGSADHHRRDRSRSTRCRKPVVAALHGTPLGGGLEVALGCHFRVAAPGTRLGLPEIKLGLMPGAGGTQRLPRLVGMDKAMAMILSGDPIDADDALKFGLVDEIASGESAAGRDRVCQECGRDQEAALPRARARGKAEGAARQSCEIRRDGRALSETLARTAGTRQGDRGLALDPRRAGRRRAHSRARHLS